MLFFNQDMQPIPQVSSVTQVNVNQVSGNGWTTLTPTGGYAGAPICCTMPEPGYVVIYVDNQSMGKDVWFDNIMVGHYTGTVQEESHYYPFGLTLQTDVQVPEVTKQVYKYNGKELEQSFGLEIYDYGARMYDPQAPHTWQIDPMAGKFVNESPYSYAGNNPIKNVDVDGMYKYPANKAAAYRDQFPHLTSYLVNNVQKDIKKSQIVQNAIVKNSHGGFTKSQLVNEVAAWGNEKSPMITFDKGLADRTGGAVGYTPNSTEIRIDEAYAATLDAILGDPKRSKEDKSAALLKFYETVLHETTHVGDLKDGVRDKDEVGDDAMFEVFHGEIINVDVHGTMTPTKVEYPDTDGPNEALDGAKQVIKRKTAEGKQEVLPTLPQTTNTN